MPITLRREEMDLALERAYTLAISKQALPAVWLERSDRLADSPSVAFIAAVGSVLLAKATDPKIDALVIQTREGSPGAFSLRAAATALAGKKRALAYDIGSSSDRDPINHGTLVGSTRWDVALGRIRDDHKPFFQLILTWLADINRMDREQATKALAAYLRARRAVVASTPAASIPQTVSDAPALPDLIQVLDGFVGADPEGGARGMALVAAAYRAAGFEATLPSRNDPRRIDVTVKREDMSLIAAEVKQANTTEDAADTLAADANAAGMDRALLAVLPPGHLVDFDRTGVVGRAEMRHGVVLRVVQGSRELLHEALTSGTDESIGDFSARLPWLFADALREIRASEQAIAAWAAIATRWK